jgi:N-acetylneuraminic acid mutarotase
MHIPRNTQPRRARRIQLLAALAGVAVAVLGLPVPALAAPVSTGPAAKPAVEALCGGVKKGYVTCFALRRTDAGTGKGLQPAVTPAGFGPADLAGAYQIPPGGGAGATVAIIDAFDDPNAEADLAVYRAQFGLPACTTANGCFRKVDQRGGTSYPPPNSGWAGEISLDLDMVSAVAPAAHILLVESDDNQDINLALAVDQAVAMGAKYVSNSYGTGYTSTPGSGEDSSEVSVLDAHYNHPGVAVTASSGDNDFGVSYPAASQYVTSVGGTSLSRDSSPRGWTESVWHNSFGGPGSGCSVFEPKPAFQTDTGCAMRAVSDVAAVADPETGVAVYDSFGSGTGWGVFGGTSASAPIIASVYAVAGTPATGSYPNSYPYARASSLNDVTTGANGTCSPAYLCTAGGGYDGPTGLGTPNGLAAFTIGAHGDIAGTVTDAGTGAPIVGAQVTAHDAGAGTDASTVTDASGHYDLSVAVGTYDVTIAAYGYASATFSGVAVADGATVNENAALTAVPRVSVSGVVTDGGGHGWPLYAKITVAGVPGGPVYTDPFTGRYALTLPQGQTYQLHVTANYPGYQAVDRGVAVGTGDVRADVSVPVDATSCTAPGYAVALVGDTQTFDAPSTPDGWTVTNNTAAGGWVFNDPKPRGNNTGGSGGFAIVDSDFLGIGNTEDTYLTSPVADMTEATAPDLSFDTEYKGFSNSTADVEVSLDGGATWAGVWHHGTDSVLGPAHVDLPLPQAAGKAAVQVRFHYVGTWAWWWKVDDVFIGTRTCNPVHGGLVAGLVTDANTGAGVTGATVSTVDDPNAHATTQATPDDPNLGDGFYWLFTSATGAHPYTAAKTHYTTASKSVNVGVDFTTRADFALTAGRITVTPASIDKTVAWQGQATQKLTLKNTGSAPATVNIGEQPGGFQLLTRGGAALNLVSGTFAKGWQANPKVMGPKTRAPADTTPSAAPWTSIADFPTAIQDNLVALVNGKLYSAFGFTGSADTADTYAYDPGTGGWTKVASAADTREKPAGAVLGGKLVAAGGWDTNGNPDAKTEIYDPVTNAWSTGANNPKPYAGSGSAALNGRLYVVGGCTASACGTTDVEVYDPVANSWSAGPAYPEATAWLSCGTIANRVYCAGGSTDAASTGHAFVLDPAAGAWSPIASLPIDLWGSGSTAANGMLLVSGGVTANSTAVTNQGYAYDPAANAWTALPNSNNSLYRGGSACGFYKVGGNPGGFLVPPVAKAEVLPGFQDCGAAAADVTWLSESPTSLTLAPGASGVVTVTLDASVPEITQPGTLTAALTLGTDTPYPVSPVNVTLTVKPPKTWGKIAGTVTSASGVPIAGATVQINTWATSYTLKTDKNGQYALWLDVRNNPLQVIVAKDGYQPQVRTVKIAKGTTTTADFSLKPAP